MSQPTAPIIRTHPLTGDPILPIGHLRGRAIWPIMGGAPDDPPAPPAGGAPTPPAGDPPPAGGAPEPPAVDLSKLTVDDLKGHPSFQSEINRVVGERLTKEKEKFEQKLATEKQRAGLDEAGKQAAALEDERAKAATAVADRANAYKLVARTKAEVLAIAAGGRADRTAAIVAQADLTGAIDDDGNVSDAVLEAAVTKVLGLFPEWKAEPGTPPPPIRSGGELIPNNPAGQTFTQSQIEAMTPEQVVENWPAIEKAMSEGKLVYGR